MPKKEFKEERQVHRSVLVIGRVADEENKHVLYSHTSAEEAVDTFKQAILEDEGDEVDIIIELVAVAEEPIFLSYPES